MQSSKYKKRQIRMSILHFEFCNLHFELFTKLDLVLRFLNDLVLIYW